MIFQIINLSLEMRNFSKTNNFALEVFEGLSKYPKRLPSWLIFDDIGSNIFQKITDLVDYHPTICEMEIFQMHKEQILNLIPNEPVNLIELGSGDGRKTKILLEHILQSQRKFEYCPIDISEGSIRNLVSSLENNFENKSFGVHGIVGSYFQGLEWLTEKNSKKNFVLFLGSSIGNFDPPATQRFLRQLWLSLNNNDYVLIGFDLMKHPKFLHRAYNDPEGIFQKFNLHLLNRINNELNADFNLTAFIQHAHFNPKTRAVESHIYSVRDQIVQIKSLKRKFYFKLWEGMQTEHSYKFTIPEIETFIRDSGFEIVQHFYDSKKFFVDTIFKVKKDS